MGKKYEIDEDYLREAIDLCARGCVGKAMKRFELSNNPTDIKPQIKEIIYESYRSFKDLMDAHAAGREQVVWQFKTKKGTE